VYIHGALYGSATYPEWRGGWGESVSGPGDIGSIWDQTRRSSTATLMRVMGDPVRFQMLCLIAGTPSREMCVSDLAHALGASQPVVSHHVKVLLASGLVSRHRRGNWAYYRLQTDLIRQVSAALAALGEDAALAPSGTTPLPR
jgi:ArsR family transcriptional regulator